MQVRLPHFPSFFLLTPRSQFVGGRRETPGAADTSRRGGHLSMYASPPGEEVTLEEFEGAAIDRLRGTPSRPGLRLGAGLAVTRRLARGVSQAELPATLSASDPAAPLTPLRAVLKGIEDAVSRGKKHGEMTVRGCDRSCRGVF